MGARVPTEGGVQPQFPPDYPLDHPDMNPVWAAVAEVGLTVLHHSFAASYPGYRDLWDNPFLGRPASHPWAAMRAVSAFFGSGIMDKYPTLRFGILESGFGWLPFWARRMDDRAVYMGTVAAPHSYVRIRLPARRVQIFRVSRKSTVVEQSGKRGDAAPALGQSCPLLRGSVAAARPGHGRRIEMDRRLRAPASVNARVASRRRGANRC